MTVINKILTYVAVFISIATYLFWKMLPEDFFYYGNALFIFIICLVIFNQNRSLFICFFLLCISLSNLCDELFFDPEELGTNEIVFALILPFIWYIKYKRNARQIRKQ